MMEYEERNALGSLLSTFVVVAFFGRQIWTDYIAGAFDGPSGVNVWAKSIVWMVPLAVVICIITVVAVHVLYAIFSHKSNPSTLVDERDRAIGRRGMQVSLVVASLGFMTAIAMLAMGWSVLAGLNIILIGFIAADVLGSLSKLIAYRFNLGL